MPEVDQRPVLIVDDDADDLFFAHRVLQKAGVTNPIMSCGDGREAVALLKRLLEEKAMLPVVIFLDVKMPHLDGFQTLRWIREQADLRGIVAVMLSGSNDAR